MKSLRERTEIQQAYLDGKQIEYKSNNDNSIWVEVDNKTKFNCWDIGNYRIKPKPMEIWVNMYDKGDCYLHKSQSKALIAVTEGCTRQAVKFVEEIK